MVRQVLPAPPGLPTGQLIGKKGNNLKHLQARSGAHIYVDAEIKAVVVTGDGKSVARAIDLLQAQFRAWKTAATTLYPQSRDIVYVLSTKGPFCFASVQPGSGAAALLCSSQVVQVQRQRG